MKKWTPEWWASLPPEKVGDATEDLVETLFKKWNTSTYFAWHRLPDAKAARGRMKAQPADYIYRSGSKSGFIEVKALKHPHRLPAERVTQLPTLKKWSLAGSFDYVLVHQYMEGVWRIIPAGLLDTRLSSWDLSNCPTFPSAEAALEYVGIAP